MEKLINQGWECPKCSRIYSPTTPMCLHCVPGRIETITTTGTGGTNISELLTTGAAANSIKDISQSERTRCNNEVSRGGSLEGTRFA